LADSVHVSQSIELPESVGTSTYESSFEQSIESTYATLLTPVHESKFHILQLKDFLKSPSTFSPVAFQNNHGVLDPTFIASLLRGCDTKGCFSSKTCTDVVPIIMDTGCSFAMTFDERDFIEIVHGTFGQVQTAGDQLPITAFGIAEEEDQRVYLFLFAFHVILWLGQMFAYCPLKTMFAITSSLLHLISLAGPPLDSG
jgi:hypothetical protein